MMLPKARPVAVALPLPLAASLTKDVDSAAVSLVELACIAWHGEGAVRGLSGARDRAAWDNAA